MGGGRKGYIYILANKSNSVIYTGVTSDLVKRIYQHKQRLLEGFSKRYNLHKLVYYEMYDSINNAIIREKQIKGLLRRRKEALIESMNPGWRDLYETLL